MTDEQLAALACDGLRWMCLHRVDEIDAREHGIPVEILGVINAFWVLNLCTHVNCLFCGACYAIARVHDHLATCIHHPMATLRRELDEHRALCRCVGR